MAKVRRRKIWKRCGVALLAALTLAALYFSLVPTRIFEAAYLLWDVAALDGPSPLKSRRGEPVRQVLEYALGETDRRAVVYRPAEGKPRAALVLVPGATPDGPDDPRLASYARTLARARFLVFIPDEPSMRGLQLNPGDALAVRDAVQYLRGQRAREGFGPIGLHAVSYSVGPAILAALDPALRGEVEFIIGIGGYYGVLDAVRFLTTGHYRAPADAATAPWRRRTPDHRMVWRFIYHNAIHIERAQDQVAMMALAQVKMRRPEAPGSPFIDDMAEDGKAVFDLADNKEPERVAELVARLPAKLRDGILGLDLARLDLSALTARLILVHGSDDPVIPPRESHRLAAAAKNASSHLAVLDAVHHAGLNDIGVADAFRMWRTIMVVLEARDRAN